MSIKSKITDTLAQLLGGVKSSVTESRASIARLEEQRQAIAVAMVPLAEAEAFVDRFVAECASEDRFSISWLASPGANAGALKNNVMQPSPYFASGPLLFLLAGDVARASLKAKLNEFYKGITPGLPAAERAAKLDQLDAEIYALEVAEEQQIDEAEQAGLQVDRRADADPAAVLGLPRLKRKIA